MQFLKQIFFDTLDPLYSKSEITVFLMLALQKITGRTKAELLAADMLQLTDNQYTQLNDVLNRLGRMEPIQYIIGECEFYGLPFSVTSDVLIPRPETEELVEWIVSDYSGKEGTLLDVGTGSGCIAVSLAKRVTGFSVSAMDVSPDAIAVAEKNAERHEMPVTFILADILDCESIRFEKKSDVIVSNPPYVRETEKKEMSQNVLNYEPHQALFVSDQNPLLFYEAIGRMGKKWLKKEGCLYFEINEVFGNEMKELLKSLDYKRIELRKDIFGKDRMIKAVKN